MAPEIKKKKNKTALQRKNKKNQEKKFKKKIFEGSPHTLLSLGTGGPPRSRQPRKKPRPENTQTIRTYCSYVPRKRPRTRAHGKKFHFFEKSFTQKVSLFQKKFHGTTNAAPYCSSANIQAVAIMAAVNMRMAVVDIAIVSICTDIAIYCSSRNYYCNSINMRSKERN